MGEALARTHQYELAGIEREATSAVDCTLRMKSYCERLQKDFRDSRHREFKLQAALESKRASTESLTAQLKQAHLDLEASRRGGTVSAGDVSHEVHGAVMNQMRVIHDLKQAVSERESSLKSVHKELCEWQTRCTSAEAELAATRQLLRQLEAAKEYATAQVGLKQRLHDLASAIDGHRRLMESIS